MHRCVEGKQRRTGLTPRGCQMLQAFQNGEGSICDAAVVLRVLGFCFSLQACWLGEVTRSPAIAARIFSIALARVFAWAQPRTRQPRGDPSPVKNVKISSYQQVKGPASFILPMLSFCCSIIGDRAEVARSATQPERRCRTAVRPRRLAATTIPPRLAYRTQ